MRGLKGQIPLEGNPGNRGYDGGGLRSRVQSRSTGRGVHGHGELKGLKPVGAGKPTSPQLALSSEGRDPNRSGVMALRLETRRSIPGQGEAERKLGGGPKGC